MEICQVFRFKHKVYSMGKLLTTFLLTLLTSGVVMAQVNRQLKKIEQHFVKFELVEGEKKLEKLSKKISLKHKRYGDFLFQKALFLQLKGNYIEALKTIDEVLEYAPKKNQSAIQALKGELLADLENYTLADSTLTKAYTLQNQNKANDFLLSAKIITQLASINIEQENYPKADSLFKEAKILLENKKQKNHLLYAEVLYRIAESQYKQDQILAAKKNVKNKFRLPK